MNVLKFINYKDYLRQLLKVSGARSGMRLRMASAMGCHSAYVSKVTHYDTDLSLEQGEKLNRFLGHTKEEGAYFLLLIQKARAGTVELRRLFQEQLDEMRAQRSLIHARLKDRQEMSEQAQAIYYSSWFYAAIHVALSIPGLHSKNKVAGYLGLPISLVSEVLDFLVSEGLVAVKADHYTKGPTHIHLGHRSPHIRKHHLNWRTQAISSLDREEAEALHYSAAVTLSREDVQKVNEILIRALEESTNAIKASKEEEVYCLSADFFRVSRIAFS